MQRPSDLASYRAYCDGTPYTSSQMSSLSLPFLGNSAKLDRHNNNNSNTINNMNISNNNSTSSQLFNINIICYLVLWYAVSSLTTQLTKYILSEFEFPVFVGEFQFGFNFLLGLLTIQLASRSSAFKSWFPPNTLPSTDTFVLNKRLAKVFFPMGTFQFVGKLFSLAATSICTVATVSSIRALSPLFIVLGYRINYKVTFSIKTYLSLVPLLMGVIILVLSQTSGSNIDSNAFPTNKVTVYNELVEESKNQETSSLAESIVASLVDSIQIHGIFFALLSTIVFAAGSIYTKSVISNNTAVSPQKERMEIAKLALFSGDSSVNIHQSLQDDLEKNTPLTMSPNYSDKVKPQSVDKLTTLMYCSIYGLAYSIPTLVTYELPTLLSLKIFPANLDSTPVIQSTSVPYYTLIPWTLLIINGISYFTQSLLAFHILGMLPTVTYSIANMMKRIIVITISMLLRGHSLSILEFLGLFHISIGLYIYEKWGSKQN
ncbi:hypothetical protein CANINC_000643 [Pichia inconspicua]|uniref:Sugar phosphate transporter domain-containing protein n=1 Tax=Pichia inconspicua TaxID=52247 RepID=A0A4T0X6N5_9ASCO|nr:hypothetical protein CANINC_000643 [[Candida] inconspicua]